MYIIRISLFFIFLSVNLFARLIINNRNAEIEKAVKKIHFSLNIDNKQIVNDLKGNIIDIKQQLTNHYDEINNNIKNFNPDDYIQKLNSENIYASFLNNVKNSYSNLKTEFNQYNSTFKNLSISNIKAKNIAENEITKKLVGNFQGIQTSQELFNLIKIYGNFQTIGDKYIIIFFPTTKAVSYYIDKNSFLMNKSNKLDFLIIKSTLLVSKNENVKNKILLFMLKFYKKKENDEKEHF